MWLSDAFINCSTGPDKIGQYCHLDRLILTLVVTKFSRIVQASLFTPISTQGGFHTPTASNMAHFSKATLIVVMAGAAYAQVLAGSADASTASAASVTATQTATAQEDATAFSILQDVSSPQVLAASAAASSASPVLNANPSVVSIFFPGADPLPYVGSIIGSVCIRCFSKWG